MKRARRPYGLHAGLEGVNWVHGHVLNGARDGPGNHELPELEAVVYCCFFCFGGVYRDFGVEIGGPIFGGGVSSHSTSEVCITRSCLCC